MSRDEITKITINDTRKGLTQDMEQYKKTVKKNIENLINCNMLKEAKKILKEYEELIPYDIDIYSIEAVIAMMEGNIDKAEKLLTEGISIVNDNFDLYYNLAYIYESKEIKLKAYKYYKEAFKYCNLEIKEEILSKINILYSEIDISEYKEQIVSTKPPAITIMTWVYNSKEYIHQCVQSVLNQSFRDFEWVILDNGCTDGTSEILESYAKKDNRIKIYKNELNSIIYNKPNNHYFSDYIYNLKSEYVCCLDSDDFLNENFFRYLYMVAKKYNADIAVGGTEAFYEEDKDCIKDFYIPTLHINDISKLGDEFPKIYGSFRPLWGKLIRTSVHKKTAQLINMNNIKLENASDTYTCLIFLKYAKSMISINKVLYYYRVRKTSHYNTQISKNRYLDYIVIYEESKKLLESWNKLNEINLNFILDVLYYSIKDCIDIYKVNANVPAKDRTEIINIILSDKKLKQIYDNSGKWNMISKDAKMAIDYINKE